MERPRTASPEQLPTKQQKELFEMLKRNEQEALMHWSDITDTAKDLGIDLDSPMDPKEADPAYMDIKTRLLKMKDETLKTLFELENQKEEFKAFGFVSES